MGSIESKESLVWSDSRFQTLAVAEGLLAQAEAGDSQKTATLAALALLILESLDSSRYGRQTLAAWAVMARCLVADARRRQGDLSGSDQEFAAVASRLDELPLDAWERAMYCRRLAALRREQGRADEVLGLLQRAADLFQLLQKERPAADSLCEAAELWLDAEEPESALAHFLECVDAFEPTEEPLLAIRIRHGMALAYAQLCQAVQAEGALRKARALYRLVPDLPEARLHFAVKEAWIFEEMGEEHRALRLLRPLVGQLLERGAVFEAAEAALALVRLLANGANRESLEQLLQEVSPRLLESDGLPAPVALAVRFALHLVMVDDRDWYELLSQVGDYLRRARANPCLEWEWESAAWTEVPWDSLDEAQRRRLCEEAGLPETCASLSGSTLSREERQLLTWTQQALHSIAVRFSTEAGE